MLIVKRIDFIIIELGIYNQIMLNKKLPIENQFIVCYTNLTYTCKLTRVNYQLQEDQVIAE